MLPLLGRNQMAIRDLWRFEPQRTSLTRTCLHRNERQNGNRSSADSSFRSVEASTGLPFAPSSVQPSGSVQRRSRPGMSHSSFRAVRERARDSSSFSTRFEPTKVSVSSQLINAVHSTSGSRLPSRRSLRASTSQRFAPWCMAPGETQRRLGNLRIRGAPVPTAPSFKSLPTRSYVTHRPPGVGRASSSSVVRRMRSRPLL